MGQAIGFWTDIYQVGVLSYVLLSGRHPFEEAKAKGVAALVDAHVSKEPPSLAELVPDLPPDIVEAVTTMLRKDGRQRVRPGKNGAPDGSAKAFRLPFRNLVRELENQHFASAGSGTTQHLMLQLLQTADEGVGPRPAAGRPRETTAVPYPEPVHGQSGSLAPLPPSSMGHTVTFGTHAGASLVAAAVGARAPVAGPDPQAPQGNTTGPMSRTAPAVGRPGRGPAAILVPVGVLAVMGLMVAGWVLTRHPEGPPAAAHQEPTAAQATAAPSSHATPAPVNSSPQAQVTALPQPPAQPAAPPAAAAVEEPSAQPVATSIPSSAGAGQAVAQDHAAKPVPKANAAPPGKPKAAGAPANSSGLWGLEVFKN
jgi:hypothetical protein